MQRAVESSIAHGVPLGQTATGSISPRPRENAVKVGFRASMRRGGIDRAPSCPRQHTRDDVDAPWGGTGGLVTTMRVPD